MNLHRQLVSAPLRSGGYADLTGNASYTAAMRQYLQTIRARMKWLGVAIVAVVPWMVEQLLGDAFINGVGSLSKYPPVASRLATLLRWAAASPFEAFMVAAAVLLVMISLAEYIGTVRNPLTQGRAAGSVGSQSASSVPHAAHLATHDAPWPLTGDAQLDLIHVELNGLRGVPVTDIEVLNALRKLFYRSLFYHIREERPGSALFMLCRARLLLQRYVGNFRSATTSRHVALAITRIIKLEHHLQELFGTPFSAELHCERFGSDRSEFLKNLPPENEMSPSQIQKGNAILKELEVHLKAAGLRD